MRRIAALVFGFLCGCGLLLLPPAVFAADGAASFREQVVPILASRCVRCHQGTAPKGDLDLTRAGRVVAGRGKGWVVVPGKPESTAA